MTKQFFCLAISLTYFLVPLSAQESLSLPVKSIFEVLQQHEIANITIKTNLDSLINVRRRETYQPATFVYEDESGNEITCSTKIKPRGKFRRRICDFPTLKLNFSKNYL